MGGQWVGPTQDAALELIKELDLETFPSYDDGESLTVLDGTVARYADETFDLPTESAMEVGRLWEQLEIMASNGPLRDTYLPWVRGGSPEPQSALLVEQGKSLRPRLGQVWAKQVFGIGRLFPEQPTERCESAE
jgi:monoamine oxidase